MNRNEDAVPPTFEPPRWLRSGKAQTIWSNYAPRDAAGQRLHRDARKAIIPTLDGDALRVHWNEPGSSAGAPVMLILHGLTGCAASGQVLGIAVKAQRAGFRVARADLRNASGSTPSAGIGHAGRSEDVRALLEHISEYAGDAPVAIVGYSLGGNIALKALGELGAGARARISAAVAISVPIDLDHSCASIDTGGNRIFRRYFLRRLGRLVAVRQRAHPDRYGDLEVDGVDSLREFDDRVVAALCGFDSAEDYYARSSSLPWIPRIEVPTLLIHARDDPFVPFEPYEDPSIAANPHVTLLATTHGGHAGFWGRRGLDHDRFWAEHRAVQYCAERALPR